MDVNVLRDAGGRISDHLLVIAKIRCLKRWTGRGVSELRKVACKTEYEDELNQRWERVRGLEEEWRSFKGTILEMGEDVCGRRNIREGKRSKGSEWWSEEVRIIV